MSSVWKRARIADVCEVVNGGTPKTNVPKYWNGKHAWITPAEMGKRPTPYVSDTQRKLSDLGLQDSSATLMPPFSVILSSRAPIGHLVINELPMATNQGCKGLVPGAGLEHKFLYYFLLGSVDLLQSLGTGATFKELSGGKLKEIAIPVPPLPEQRRIVAILDKAFAAIATAKANTEKNLQNARVLFQCRPPLVEAKKVLLGDLVDIKTGKLDANAAVDSGKYPFFTCSREIYAIDDFAFDCEAVLLAGNNAVGDFNVKHYKGKFNAYQRTYVITVNRQRRILYRFLYFQILKSLAKLKAQSVGVGTKFLKLGIVKGMEIELPDLAEQQHLVSILDGVREQTDRLESICHRKAGALEDLKRSLLHKAFSGAL